MLLCASISRTPLIREDLAEVRRDESVSKADFYPRVPRRVFGKVITKPAALQKIMVWDRERRLQQQIIVEASIKGATRYRKLIKSMASSE
jgi:hypothetical protein